MSVRTQIPTLTTIMNIDTVQVPIAIPMTQFLRLDSNRTNIYDNKVQAFGDRALRGGRYPLSAFRQVRLHPDGRIFGYGDDQRIVRFRILPTGSRPDSSRVSKPISGRSCPVYWCRSRVSCRLSTYRRSAIRPDSTPNTARLRRARRSAECGPSSRAWNREKRSL